MTVYLVESSYWDETDVEGVYTSSDGARRAHPADWQVWPDGSACVKGLPPGYHIKITPHEVQE